MTPCTLDHDPRRSHFPIRWPVQKLRKSFALSNAVLRDLDHPATAEENAYFLANLPLWWKHIATFDRRFAIWRRTYEPDDMLSIAYLAVIRAQRTYRPDPGMSLSSWASRIVLQTVEQMHWKCPATRFIGHAIGPAQVTLAIGDAILAPIECPSPADDQQDEASAAFANLKDRWQAILADWLGLDGPAKTMQEIASERGVTKARIGQIVSKCLDLIRDDLGFRPGQRPQGNHKQPSALSNNPTPREQFHDSVRNFVEGSERSDNDTRATQPSEE